MSSVAALTDATFDEQVMKSALPVMVDFSATWCGPCKALAPIVDQLAADYAGKVSIFKMDIDDNQETPSKFGVMSVPTLLFFKGGKLVDQAVGLQQKPKLAGRLDALLK